jgi:predicted lipoprotein with Yx(FWY)xxD motif
MACVGRAVLVISIAFLAFWARTSLAASPDGVPVCTASNDQVLPVTVADGSGGTIVVWLDNRAGIGADVVFAQRLSPASVPLWDPNGVQLSTTADAGPPVAVADGAGGAFIAFGGTSSPPRAQRVNASGAPQWGNDGVAVTNESGSTRHLAIAADIGGSGGAFVAWRKDLGAGGTADVYAQKLDGAGSTLWNQQGVAIAATNMNSEGNPAIVSDGVGGAIFAWISGAGVRAQRFDGAGISAWNAANLAASGNNIPPSIVSDGANGAVIAWSGGGAFIQRVTSNGNRLWNPANGGVTLATSGRAPTLIGDGAGSAIAVWEDNRAATNFNLYVQRPDPNTGAALWQANGTPLCMATQDQRSPRIVSDGSGGAIISWHDERNGASGRDIYAQRINGVGTSQWLVDGVPVSTATDNQDEATIATDGAGGAWVAWQDRRSGTNGDIYAARVNPDGAVLDVPLHPVTDDLGRAWPHPFSHQVTMEFALPAAADVRMRVYDLGGRMIADLGRENLSKGRHQVTWDGRRDDGRPLGGGVYFIRVEGPGVAVSRAVTHLR